jgi:hypothetical protein
MKNELPIPPAIETATQSMEMLRVWIADGSQHVSLTGNLWKDPASWGLLLVDLTKHIANAYQAQGRDRSEVLRRVKEGFDAEWGHATDEPTGHVLK